MEKKIKMLKVKIFSNIQDFNDFVADKEIKRSYISRPTQLQTDKNAGYINFNDHNFFVIEYFE